MMLSPGSFLLLCILAIEFKFSIQHSPWISDTEYAYNITSDGANIYNSATHNITRISFSNFFDQNTSCSYSSNLNYCTVQTARSEAFRKPQQVVFSVEIHDRSKNITYSIIAFKWSHGAAYAFQLDNEIYYVSSPEQSPIKVSSSDEGREIIRGLQVLMPKGGSIKPRKPFGREGNMWFSPSDKYLAYPSAKYNNETKKVPMTTYSRDEAYDFEYSLEYPKTGEKPLTGDTISIWSLEANKLVTMDAKLRDNSSSDYLFGMSWVVLHGRELLVVTWANRWQNKTSITICSYENANCSLLYEHNYEHSQWATPSDYANIVHSNTSIFVILPEASEDNAWQHIAKIAISADYGFESLSYLPAGAYDVRNIIAYRPVEDIVFYSAQAPQPWNLHVYSTPAGAGSVLKADQCVSCLSSNCTFQGQVSVSRSGSCSIGLWCRGPSESYHAMLNFNEAMNLNGIVRLDERSTNITSEIPEWKTEIFTLANGYVIETIVNVAGKGASPKLKIPEAIVRIYEGNTSLSTVPVTLHVYGGPEDNQATDFPSSIPTGYEHAIVHIDVRGSGGRGWKYRSAIYGRLVTVEVEDTIEAMKMVLEKYPRLDKKRVGVYGWSYGGTLTTALVEKAPPAFFKCVIAGAPVTNFIYYRTDYTERYMGDAPHSSYTDLTLDVSAFRHTKLLLVHGLRDDNVMFQNSALLIEALQQADIPFELMVYPNQDHNLYINPDVASHFDHLFKSFFSTCYE